MRLRLKQRTTKVDENTIAKLFLAGKTLTEADAPDSEEDYYVELDDQQAPSLQVTGGVLYFGPFESPKDAQDSFDDEEMETVPEPKGEPPSKDKGDSMDAKESRDVARKARLEQAVKRIRAKRAASVKQETGKVAEAMKNARNKMLEQMRASVRAEILKEAGIDVDTTIDSNDTMTDGGSGSHNDNFNDTTTNQTATDAGKNRPTDVGADRGPDTDSGMPGAEKLADPMAGGMKINGPDNSGQASELGRVTESAPGIFTGNFVKVYDRGTRRQVDCGVVEKVGGGEVVLKGNYAYAADKYDVIRFA